MKISFVNTLVISDNKLEILLNKFKTTITVLTKRYYKGLKFQQFFFSFLYIIKITLFLQY